MGKVTGFLEYTREVPERRPVAERINDWFEIYHPFPEEKIRLQGARCMDCGIPFCHTGCPVTNIIPDWNDLVWRGRWREASRVLHSTNNFPEFTGRICPAPCEAACVLGINEPAGDDQEHRKDHRRSRLGRRLDRSRTAAVADGQARRGGWFGPRGTGRGAATGARRACRHRFRKSRPHRRTAALRHSEFQDGEASDRPAHRADARAKAWNSSSTPTSARTFRSSDLRRDFDAIVLAGGAEHPRDLNVPGRELKGIHFAMEFLPQSNKVCEGDSVPDQILATGKRVVIIGGGDTGADCLGTSHRQKAAHISQFELLPKPPDSRAPQTPWPLWPMQLRVESSHEEGGLRDWSVSTVRFSGDAHGNVTKLHGVRVGAPPKFEALPGTEFEMDVDLVLLAMGFTGPVRGGLLDELGVALDARGNVATDENYMSSEPGVFAAGDTRRGQSLVVWAIAEGRKAARGVDEFLMGTSKLPD